MGFSEDCTNASGSSALTVEETGQGYGNAGTNISPSQSCLGKYASGWHFAGSKTITIDNFPNIVIVSGSISAVNMVGITCGYNCRVDRSGFGTVVTGSQRNISRDYIANAAVIGYQTDVPLGTYTYSVYGWQQYNQAMMGNGSINVAVIYNA